MRVRDLVLLVEFFDGEFTFFVKFVCELKLVSKCGCFIVILDPFLLGTQVFDDYLGFPGVVPKIRCKGFFFFVGNFYKLGINVKDTSLAHQDALQYL